MKKIFLIISALLAFSFASKAENLRILAEAGDEATLTAAIAQFEEANPGVTVEASYLGWDDFMSTIKLKMADNNPPDLAHGNQGFTVDGTLIQSGLVISLEKYADQYGWKDLFASGALAEFMWSDDGATWGSGNLYGISPVAEDVIVSSSFAKSDDPNSNLYSGSLNVKKGKVVESVFFEGKSLVSSAQLTAKAFSQGVLGEYGGKLVAIALLLFAFSTAITWCYYGDRSTAYIFGERGVFWYRNVYVVCFMLAAVIDTTIVWNIAYVVVALVSIPNLIALFFLRNEMKDLTNEFVVKNFK